MKKTRFIDELMNETIVYGGLRATRQEVFDDVIALGHTAKIADMFAFGPRAVAVDPESVRHLPSLRQMREAELAGAN